MSLPPDDLDDLDPMPPDLLDGDDVVVSVRDRQAALRPSSAHRATPDQHEVIHELQRTALAIAEHQAELRTLVEEGRELGLSWGLVGWCVGLTAEGARLKYGAPPAAPRSSRPARRRRAR